MSEAWPKWRPIETAPKDGTKVVVYDEGDVWIAYWYRTSPQLFGWWAIDHGVNPTHWLPLPPPPEGGAT